MTDIVVGVRLNADGTGLVGQLKLSRAELEQLRGSEKAAADAARDLSQATASAGAAAGKSAGETRKDTEAKEAAARAKRDAAKAAREEEGALADFRKMLDPAAIEQAKLNRQLELNDILHRKGLLSANQHADVQRRLTGVTQQLTTNVGLQRAGYLQLGYQMQDVFASYASGTRLSVIAAQQIGQFGSALTLLGQASEGGKGKLASFASFIGGPWGIALTVGASVATALASTLLKTDEASASAQASTIDFSNSLVAASGLVKNYTETIQALDEATRGLINTQALMIDNSRLFAQKSVSQLTAQLTKIDEDIAQRTASPSALADVFDVFGNRAMARGELINLNRSKAELEAQLNAARGALASAQTAYEARNANESADPKARGLAEIERQRARLTERRRSTLEQGPVPLAEGGLETISEGEFQRQLATLKTRENALRDARKPKKDNSAAKAAREAVRLEKFGERAEDAIARLNDQFNVAPRDIDRARQSTVQLDAIIADLEKRKPPNYQKLIEQAKAVKPLIEDSLARPIREMLGDQQREIELGKLRLSGREADAHALQVTYGLMDKLGVESEAQLATELMKRGIRSDEVRQLYDNLGVMRQQTLEMRSQQALQQAYLTSVTDMRENVRQTLEGLRSDGPKAFGDFFKRSLDVADRLFADVVTEKFFGSFFRDLEDQVTGADQVSKAGEKMAVAVEKAAIDIVDLGKAAKTAADIMSGKTATSAAGDVPAGWIVGDDGKAFDPNIEIVSTGTAKPDTLATFKSAFKDGYEDVFNDLKSSLKSTFNDVFGDNGVFSASVSKSMGRALGGAQIGATVGKGVSDALGMKGSSTGGALGGAAGSLLEGTLNKVMSGLGPFGSIIGGIAGSLIGGMFKSTPRASANLTGGSEADMSVTGNKSALKDASVGLGSSVQDTLKQLAEEFGGEVGKFAVSIGISGDSFHVDPTGRGRLKKSQGGKDFNDDEAGAIAYAVMDAISDGGITGISAAVQKALRSSKDLDDAIAEALKVREVEELLGGLGSEMQRAFRDFEAQAKDRLRIASDYGFDVVEIEKRNAEDRAKLVDELLSSRIGSLQGLLDDLKFGNLFEGSAADQRQALLAQIATARADAEAGKDGAADTLSNLSRQLVELSRDAFGTAGGEYAADRSTAISSAEAVIKAENDRIKAAQDAVAATNTKLDTANTLATQQVNYLSDISSNILALVQQSSTSGLPPPLDPSLVAR
ncbi:hypothetical protein [Sphingobium aromaticiconvertens]|uniref:hypothetical protein n=1 Tax=Sphingobium aromaticiconvertens TaxID=365341 RepID=UPI003015B15F